MSDTLTTNNWLSERAEGRRFALALVAGLVLEVGALGVAVPLLAHERPPADQQSQVVKLSIMAPAPAPPAPPPPKPAPKIPPPPRHVVPPPPLPAPPLPVAAPLPPPVPVRPARPLHHFEHVRHVRPPPPVPPPPVQQAPPAPAPPMPAAPAPAAPSAGEMDIFKSEMRRAVQAAAVDPAAAEMAHESGVVRVEFTYLDGVASDIEVIASCGFPMLDDAAMQAVRHASFPPAPADFSGHAADIVVDVIFRSAAADVDSD